MEEQLWTKRRTGWEERGHEGKHRGPGLSRKLGGPERTEVGQEITGGLWDGSNSYTGRGKAKQGKEEEVA